MKIHLLSDLHIEHFPDLAQFQAMYKERYNNELLENNDQSAQVLVLAGDIGNVRKEGYQQFLTKASSLYEHVIVVGGNHEFYGNEYFECMEKMKTICKEIGENVHFLDKEKVEIVDPETKEVYVFIGAILWSNIPEESQQYIESAMNDYRLIKIKEGDQSTILRAKHTVQMFKEESEYIRKEIENAKEKEQKVIVVSHNAPLNRGEFELCIATDLSSMMENHVVAWLFGHTHYSSLQKFNNTIVASNQLGYLRGFSKEENSYKPDWILDTNNLNLNSIPKFVPYPPKSETTTTNETTEKSSKFGFLKFFKK